MKNKILNFFELEKNLKPLRKKKIVHCHGVFDLIHIGHLKHFESAKKYGDILIVSLTPDKYVSKGFNRPYFNSEQRLESLSLIESIDYVVLNKTSNAVDIINKIKPNFYCKGPDYRDYKNDITGQIKNEENAVKKNKGKIVFTKDETYSSSAILNKFSNTFDYLQKKFISKIKNEINLNKFNSQFKKLEKLKVLVIGETIIDNYIYCEALGKSGKEPHLVLRDLYEEHYLGGVIAIGKNISNFCKKVGVLTMLGKDKKFQKLIKKNLSKNVDIKYLYKSNSPTIIKKRYIEHVSKNKIFGVYSLNDELLNKKDEILFKKIVEKEIRKYDIVVVSDYGHGLISDGLAKLLCKKSKFLALNAQANASNIGYHTIQKYHNVDCVVMNETELRHELRDKNEKLNILIKRLAKKIKIKNLIVTRGSEGAILFNSNKNKYFDSPAFASKVVDKVGAGDSMLSIISIMLKLKFKELTSLFLGSLAGAISVGEMSNKFSISKVKLLKYMSHTLK